MFDSDKRISKRMVGMGILAIVLNVAFWGSLIYFVFLSSRHFGLI